MTHTLHAQRAPFIVRLAELPANTTFLYVGAYDESTDTFTGCELHDGSPSAGIADLVLPAYVVGLLVGFDEPAALASTRWYITRA